jgi:hypothetical protein
MNLNESVVEDAALTGIGELIYSIGQAQQFAPGEWVTARNLFGEAGLATVTQDLQVRFEMRTP